MDIMSSDMRKELFSAISPLLGNTSTDFLKVQPMLASTGKVFTFKLHHGVPFKIAVIDEKIIFLEIKEFIAYSELFKQNSLYQITPLHIGLSKNEYDEVQKMIADNISIDDIKIKLKCHKL